MDILQEIFENIHDSLQSFTYFLFKAFLVAVRNASQPGPSEQGLARQSDISKPSTLRIVATSPKPPRQHRFHRTPRQCDRITPSRSNPSARPVVPNLMKSTSYNRAPSPLHR
jgi:hypothetical protein